MNKQNKKKKVDLSEGALSDPQGCLVPCHTLGSGLTFCHFLPLAPLPSALCCSLHWELKLWKQDLKLKKSS